MPENDNFLECDVIKGRVRAREFLFWGVVPNQEKIQETCQESRAHYLLTKKALEAQSICTLTCKSRSKPNGRRSGTTATKVNERKSAGNRLSPTLIMLQLALKGHGVFTLKGAKGRASPAEKMRKLGANYLDRTGPATHEGSETTLPIATCLIWCLVSGTWRAKDGYIESSYEKVETEQGL